VALQVKISPKKPPKPPEPPKPKAPPLPEWLQHCDPDATDNYANGQIPSHALCALPDGKGELRADAAAAYWKLDQAYTAHFGEPICITDSYRSLDSQYRLAATKSGLAARPGTSNHGRGIALDLCGGVESTYSEEHEWFLGNAPRFGWHLPEWARPGGSRPEPWHWEYEGA
jgi:LAS superfamily LD-carboxypeptidase LdcB